jgi:outer membrane translocation and assembly module TamA
MRNLLIVFIIITTPLFANAQSFNPSQIKPRNSPFPMNDDRPPQLVQLPTMKPISSLSHIEKAQAKLTREEQKLIKLARKAWDQEDNLKKEQEQLKILENTSESNNEPDHQERIENAKKQIVKSQDKLNKVKAEVESESKKVEDLEKAIEEAKFTRHE